jgi:sugar phosphate isomerase/epimerase
MKTNMMTMSQLFRFMLIIVLTNIAAKGFSTIPEDFKPELGVCTSLANAEMLSTHGFSYIEESVGGFLMPLKSEEEFNERLELALQLPIPIKACNSFIPGNLKSVGPDAVHDEILKYVETAFRRAQKAGIEVIVFGSGGSRSIPDGFSREEARKQFIELGKAMGPVAARYNVVVALEPLNTSEVNFINSVTEGGKIIEEIDHPNFMLLADIFHMMKENEGPESIIEYGHLIKHVHVAELEGRSAPGTHNEDLSPYYDALKQINYQGRISIEGRWENMEMQAPKAIKTIRQQL